MAAVQQELGTRERQLQYSKTGAIGRERRRKVVETKAEGKMSQKEEDIGN